MPKLSIRSAASPEAEKKNTQTRRVEPQREWVGNILCGGQNDLSAVPLFFFFFIHIYGK
jgi:hypothetical protein